MSDEVSKKINFHKRLMLILKYIVRVWKNNKYLRKMWEKGCDAETAFKQFWYATRQDIKQAIQNGWEIMFSPDFSDFRIITQDTTKQPIKADLSDDDKLNAEIFNQQWKQQKEEFEHKLARGDLPVKTIIDEYYYRTGKHFVKPEEWYGDCDVSDIVCMFDVKLDWFGLREAKTIQINDKVYKNRIFLKV